MRRPRSDSGRIAALAREASEALALGPVSVPGLGGRIVLARDPGVLVREYGDAFLLVGDARRVTGFPAWTDKAFRTRVRKLLHSPVVARLPAKGGWSGYGLASEALLRAILAAEPGPVGFGLPRPVAETGPGPTVVDFSTRPPRVDLKGAVGILELEQRLDGPVRLGPDLVFGVLVVCTGNACRSPMAAGILERLLARDRAFVESAGTAAPVGSPATDFAVAAAAELGADISGHRARLLDPEMVRRADLVLVMEKHHRRLVSLVPGAAARTRLLGDYLPGARAGTEIADPIGRPLEVYRRTAADIARACERVAGEVRARLTGTEAAEEPGPGADRN